MDFKILWFAYFFTAKSIDIFSKNMKSKTVKKFNLFECFVNFSMIHAGMSNEVNSSFYYEGL